MNNFQKFYFDITGFRDEMKGAVKRYQVTIKELERFKGSAGYNEEMKKAETAYRTETEAIRALYSDNVGDTGDHVSNHAWSLFRLDHDYANAEECVSQFCAGTDVQMLEKFINITE